MTDAYYTDLYQSEESSVIDSVYYDSQTKTMYVSLLNGTLCGYADVNAEVFRAFVGQEAAGYSLGSYWNNYIKKGLKGISTDDIGFFLNRLDQDVTPTEQAFIDNENLNAMAPTEERLVTLDEALAEADTTRNEYLIAFEHDGGEGEIILYADSIEEALANFNIVRGAARYVNVAINSVTLFFNN